MAIHPHGLPVLHSHLNTYNGLYSLYFKKVHATTAGILPEHIPALLPGMSVAAFVLYEYSLGFYVQKGNPKNILSVSDLKRPDVALANREKGSTGRMYLDILLKDAKILPDQINGYQKELVSDFSTANAVLTSQADAALGAESVIFKSKDLDFIPLQQLPMFLVMETESLNRPGFLLLQKSSVLRNSALPSGCKTAATPPEPEKYYICKAKTLTFR